jgi:hypothetical protein
VCILHRALLTLVGLPSSTTYIFLLFHHTSGYDSSLYFLSRPALYACVCPSHTNEGSSYHCLDNHQWLLNAQLDLPSSPYVTVVHKVVLGYIPPLHGLKIFNVLARSALNMTKEFTLKCINSLHPTANFPLFQSNIQNLSLFYSI